MPRPKEIQIYTAQDLKRKPDGSLALEVALNPKTIDLPLVNVGTEDNPAYIALLDPRVPELQKHGAKVISEYLDELGISLVITAPSPKSEQMILEATILAKLENEPIIVLGGSEQRGSEKHILSEEEVAEKAQLQSQTIWIEECRPITLGPNDHSKFFALTEQMLEKIIDSIQKGERVAVVDDVFSSGATIDSLKKLIAKALLEKGVSTPTLPTIVIAREVVETSPLFQDREILAADNQSLNLYAAMLIPIVLSIPEKVRDVTT